MAAIKWGALVVDGRGKLGGQVLSKNRNGAYIRNKVTPVNPRTSFQQTARQQLGALSAQWKALTESEREAWRSAVSQYEKTNIFGDKVQPTGKNLFVGLNRNLSNIDEAIITSPVAPVEFPVISLNTLVVDASSLSVTMDPPTIPAGYKVLWWATAPLSPGVNFVASEFKMLDASKVAPVAGVYDLITPYSDRLGDLPEGQKVFLKATLVSTSSGQKGTPVTISGLVAP